MKKTKIIPPTGQLDVSLLMLIFLTGISHSKIGFKIYMLNS